MKPAYVYRAKCTRVIDGDTFVAQVDLGFYASIQLHVRIRGVNAPELRDAGGRAARDYLVTLIDGKEIVLQSFHEARSFERWVCDVWVADVAVGEAMITGGHGVIWP
jgi:micrococcal nuclease